MQFERSSENLEKVFLIGIDQNELEIVIVRLSLQVKEYNAMLTEHCKSSSRTPGKRLFSRFVQVFVPCFALNITFSLLAATVRVRGGGKLNIAWNEGRLIELRLQSDNPTKYAAKYGDHSNEIQLQPDKPVILDGELRRVGQ